jgi:hypothetical protein
MFKIGDIVKHKKGGFYVIVRLAWLERNLEEVYVYELLGDVSGYTWVRAKNEMEDGRFELIPPVPEGA